MKPESILKADILDILFENRNKDYGAYELRTHYPNRLKKSMIIIFLAVTISIIINYWITNNTGHKNISLLSPDVQLIDYPITIIPLKPSPASPARKAATIQNAKPVIVRENIEVNPPPPNTDLIQNQIGAITGTENNIESNQPAGNGTGSQTDHSTITGSETEQETIVDHPDIMPEFPGGLNALQRFLSKNLRMPKDNLDAGTSIRVMVRFVVDKEGIVTGITLIQSGGDDFDKEVIRVMKKLPQWKPGMQHGNKVAVYYHLPVVFEVPLENQ